MKKRKSVSSLFVKFLFSYILTLFLPLALIIWFVFGGIMQTIENDLIQQNVSRLSKTEFTISSNIEGVWKIRDQILLNQMFEISSDLQHVDQILRVMQEMQKYTIGNDFLLDMAVYLEGDNYVYTSHSSWTVVPFLKQLYPSKQLSTTDFSSLLENKKILRTESYPGNSGNSKEAIMQAVSFYTAPGEPAFWLMFFIDKQYLETTLYPNMNEETGTYAILDGNSEEIVSVGQMDPVWTAPDLEWNSLNSRMQYAIAIVDGQKNLVCRVDSSVNDWQYLSVLSEHEAFENIIILRKQFILILVAVITGSCFIVFFSMQTNYKPVQRLKKHAEELLHNKTSTRNEITYINNAFDQLVSHNLELQAEVEESSKDYRLRQLLLGDFSAHQKIPFNHTYFCVIIVMLDRKKNHPNLNCNLVELLRTHVEGYLLQDSEMNRSIFIANPSSNINWTPALQDMYQSLKQSFPDCSVFLAASKLFNSISDISIAYQQALLATEYRFVRGNDSLLSFDDLKLKRQFENNYPHALFEKLSNSVKTGNTKQMNELLDSFIIYIREGEFEIFYAKALSYELINIIYRVVLSLGNINFSNSIFDSYREKIDKIETLTDLVETIRFFGNGISQYITQFNADKKKNLLSEIKACIEEELHNSNFSGQYVAERFYMSPANLSQYFKSKTGTTLISYITELRMTKAKELLVTTNLSLSEICEKVGYFNASSFIRRFKQLYGLTPNQYKEQQSEALSQAEE